MENRQGDPVVFERRLFDDRVERMRWQASALQKRGGIIADGRSAIAQFEQTIDRIIARMATIRQHPKSVQRSHFEVSRFFDGHFAQTKQLVARLDELSENADNEADECGRHIRMLPAAATRGLPLAQLEWRLTEMWDERGKDAAYGYVCRQLRAIAASARSLDDAVWLAAVELMQVLRRDHQDVAA